jgi:hypothetical protein
MRKGFCVSLSGLQYVFYALQLLSPKVNTDMTLLRSFPILLAILGAIEAGMLFVFQNLSSGDEFSTIYIVFQLSLVLLPSLVALLAFCVSQYTRSEPLIRD